MMVIGDGGHARVIHNILSLGIYADDGCVIAVGDNRARKAEAEKHPHYRFTVLKHPSAIIAQDVEIGAGSVIMAGAVIQPGARIGEHVIVNTGASVDHDCVIEDYAHIAPGAHLCGHVEIGEGTLVGVGVGIAPLCKVPAWSIVKARRLEIEPLSGN